MQTLSFREFLQESVGALHTGWHLASKPNFKVDPHFKPELNSLGGDILGDARPAGIFVTDQPEYWMQAHGYERPYVAHVRGRATNPPGTIMHKSRETFLQGNVVVLRVLTIDEYCRETFNEPGWVEDYHGDPLPSDWPRRGSRVVVPAGYKARTTANMSPTELREWERKFKEWRKRSR